MYMKTNKDINKNAQKVNKNVYVNKHVNLIKTTSVKMANISFHIGHFIKELLGLKHCANYVNKNSRKMVEGILCLFYLECYSNMTT